MNKLKHYIVLFSVLVLVVPAVTLSANDVTFESGASIQLSGDSSNYIVGTDTTFQSMTANPTNFSFVVVGSSYIDLTSSDKRSFTVTGNTSCALVRTCGESSSQITLDCPGSISETTITVTPGETCVQGTSGSYTDPAPAPSSSGSSSGSTSSGSSATKKDEPKKTETKTTETKTTNVVRQTYSTGSSTKTTIANTTHTVKVITAGTNEATVSIQSDPITLELIKNIAQDIDTDGNGMNDLRVTYFGLVDGKADIKLEAITEKPGDTAKSTVCPLQEKKAYKHPGSRAVYFVTAKCTKRAFKNPNIFFSYFTSWKDVRGATKATLDKIPNDALSFMPWGPKYDPQYGALVKITSDPKVYLLLGTEKYWITSESVFNALKYSWNWIEDVAEDLLDKYTTGSEITDTSKHPNHTLIKYADSPKVYKLMDGKKRHIKNEAAFNKLKYRWDRIVTIDKSETYPDGAELK